MRFLHMGLDKEKGETVVEALERLAVSADENGIDSDDRHLACEHWLPKYWRPEMVVMQGWELHLCPKCFDEVQIELAFTRPDMKFVWQ